MIESQSESSFPPPLKVRGARGVMKPDGWIRGREENNAWPGQKCLSGGVYLRLVGDERRPYSKCRGGSCTLLKWAAC